MIKDESKRGTPHCCHFCNVMNPTMCSAQDRMTAKMAEKCPSFIPAGALDAEYFSGKYKLTVNEDGR